METLSKTRCSMHARKNKEMEQLWNSNYWNKFFEATVVVDWIYALLFVMRGAVYAFRTYGMHMDVYEEAILLLWGLVLLTLVGVGNQSAR